MTLPANVRNTIIEGIKAALLKIDGGDEYFFDLKRVGLASGLFAPEEITPDRCPNVFVIGGDHRRSEEAPVNIGRKETLFEAVIWSLIKTDDQRWPSKSISTLQELWIADAEKALELYARAFSCSSFLEMSVSVAVDPRGSYAYQEFVLTYKLRGVIGT